MSITEWFSPFPRSSGIKFSSVAGVMEQTCLSFTIMRLRFESWCRHNDSLIGVDVSVFPCHGVHTSIVWLSTFLTTQLHSKGITSRSSPVWGSGHRLVVLRVTRLWSQRYVIISDSDTLSIITHWNICNTSKSWPCLYSNCMTLVTLEYSNTCSSQIRTVHV